MFSFHVPTYNLPAINATGKQEVATEAFSSESACFMNRELTGKGQSDRKAKVNHEPCPPGAAAMDHKLLTDADVTSSSEAIGCSDQSGASRA